MSDEPTERDVEALAEIIYGSGSPPLSWRNSPHRSDREQFAWRDSQWKLAVKKAEKIAERIAEARREALTEATDAIGGLIAAHRHDSSEPCDLAPALAAVAALRGDA